MGSDNAALHALLMDTFRLTSAGASSVRRHGLITFLLKHGLTLLECDALLESSAELSDSVDFEAFLDFVFEMPSAMKAPAAENAEQKKEGDSTPKHAGGIKVIDEATPAKITQDADRQECQPTLNPEKHGGESKVPDHTILAETTKDADRQECQPTSNPEEKKSECETSSKVPTAEKPKASEPQGGSQASVTSPGISAPVGDLLRGLSVSYLSGQFLELMRVESNSDKIIYDIEPSLREKSQGGVCPRDGRPGRALVDVAADAHAGRATQMLSYSWKYRVVDVIRSLTAFCEVNKIAMSSVQVWLCCCCMNQHRVREAAFAGRQVPLDEFGSAFTDRMRSIGSVLAIFSPGPTPLYTSRAWCLYEFYTASTLDGVQLDIVLPPKDARAVTAAVERDGDQATALILNIKVEDAVASLAADREAIFKLLEQGPGIETVNKAVARQLQERFFAAAAKCASAST